MRIAMAVVLMASGVAAWGSEEDIHPPHRVVISAVAGGSFGDVTVEIQGDKSPAPRRILSIRLKVGGRWKEAPGKAFADLEGPLLDTVELRTEAGYDGSPWLYICFETAHRNAKGLRIPKRVRIAYHQGRFEYRTVVTAAGASPPEEVRTEL